MAPTLRTRKYQVARNEPYKQTQRRQTSNISSSWQRPEAGLLVSRGLRNTSNFCYMLSTFQALIHIPKVVNWLEDHYNHCVGDCLVCHFGFFSRQYWEVPYDREAIDLMLCVLRSELGCADAFRNVRWDWNAQHDADEFYTLFIEALIESNPWEKPIMQSLFQHDIRRTITCPHCGVRSHRSETYNKLDIYFNNSASLTHILRNQTFGPSILEGRYCSNCKQEADSLQTARLETSPDILMLQLVRFNHDGTKKLDEIKFSDYLNLTTYTTTKKTPTVYRLSSVVHHYGTMDYGHYVTVALSPNGVWEQIDDERVSRVRISEALKGPRRPEGGWTPYLLFYTRQDCHAGVETQR